MLDGLPGRGKNNAGDSTPFIRGDPFKNKISSQNPKTNTVYSHNSYHRTLQYPPDIVLISLNGNARNVPYVFSERTSSLRFSGGPIVDIFITLIIVADVCHQLPMSIGWEFTKQAHHIIISTRTIIIDILIIHRIIGIIILSLSLSPSSLTLRLTQTQTQTQTQAQQRRI